MLRNPYRQRQPPQSTLAPTTSQMPFVGPTTAECIENVAHATTRVTVEADCEGKLVSGQTIHGIAYDADKGACAENFVGAGESHDGGRSQTWGFVALIQSEDAHGEAVAAA